MTEAAPSVLPAPFAASLFPVKGIYTEVRHKYTVFVALFVALFYNAEAQPK